MFDATIIEICFSIISLIGMAGVSRHEFRFLGFIICAGANVAWIALGFMIWHIPYILLFGGYLIFNTIGVLDEYATWKKIREASKNHL